jgi:prepilin-type N-terminal cleavage/methylation domain-containing protein
MKATKISFNTSQQMNGKLRPKSLGFTLIELMSVTALIGILISVAFPIVIDYRTKARVTEGVLLLSELRRRVEIGFNRTDQLDVVIPSSPPADGTRFGGPVYNYSTLFGAESEMWDTIEYQAKGPHRVLVLRAQRKPEWGNSDIGLHLQIRDNGDDTLGFRCTINNLESREPYVPSTCMQGSVDDWVSW